MIPGVGLSRCMFMSTDTVVSGPSSRSQIRALVGLLRQVIDATTRHSRGFMLGCAPPLHRLRNGAGGEQEGADHHRRDSKLYHRVNRLSIVIP